MTARMTGDADAWPQIWALNPELTNPHWLEPGTTIRFVASAARAPQVLSNMEVSEGTQTPVAMVQPVVQVPPPRLRRTRVYAGLFLTPAPLAAFGEVTHASVERMLLRPRDRFFARLDPAVAVGATVMVYRPLRQVAHPQGGAQLGYLSEATGTAVVRARQGEIATLELRTAVREVERGQRLAALPRDLFMEVPDTPLSRPIAATVVALEGGAVVVGEQHLVFIDRGQRAGLQPGNVLQVQRNHDSVRKADGLPATQVAELVVVRTEADVAACLVVDAVQEIVPGAQVTGAVPGAAKASPMLSQVM